MKQSVIRNTDVAVLGGGPAGAAIALELLNRGYSTVVIERSDYRGARIGETLPPAVRPLLIGLGIWDRFLAEKHSPSFGIRAAWGADELHDNDFIFNPYGAGWHVDRARFDEMLARCAEEEGASVYRDARLSSCESNKAGNWDIQVTCGDRPRRFLAKFLIDATGRASWLARKQGARRITSDRLIGVLAFFAPGPAEAAPDSFTLIEAVETGWWYSAFLPGSRVVVAYMTDADICAKGRRQSGAFWQRQLQTTKHTRSRVRHNVQASSPRVVPANSSRLDKVGNGNWLAIGDAAMAFDPLSGQGVYQALKSAFRAAESIGDYLAGNKAATRDYSTGTAQDYKSYLNMRGNFYAKERRWPNSTFWVRRHS